MFVRLSKYQKLQKEAIQSNFDLLEQRSQVYTLTEKLNSALIELGSLRVENSKAEVVADAYLKLIARINQLGGENFLNGTTAHPYIRADLSEAKLKHNRPSVEVRGFSESELKSLLQLVHPDKHDGKESAVRMTQLINKLRG